MRARQTKMIPKKIVNVFLYLPNFRTKIELIIGKIAATLGVIGAIAVGSVLPATAWYGYGYGYHHRYYGYHHRYHHRYYAYYPHYHHRYYAHRGWWGGY